MSAYSTGLYGEQLAISEFRRAGYLAVKLHAKCCGDLAVFDEFDNRITVEVKTANRGKDGYYKACLQKYWQGRQCAAFNADYLLLICLRTPGVAIYFLVPDHAVGLRRQVSVRNPLSSRSWLTPFRVKSSTLYIPHIQFFARSNMRFLMEGDHDNAGVV